MAEPANAAAAPLAARIDALLPQTNCRKCGHAGCLPYAEAIAAGAALNRCPPGGAAGIERLAALLGRAALPLDPDCGTEQPLRIAQIDAERCIGCALCLAACPVDAIVGARRRMHDVLAAHCTGCERCIAPCPMDCIALVPAVPARAWTTADADAARQRHRQRTQRLAQAGSGSAPQAAAPVRGMASGTTDATAAPAPVPALDGLRRQSVVQAAIERARARRQAAQPPA